MPNLENLGKIIEESSSVAPYQIRYRKIFEAIDRAITELSELESEILTGGKPVKTPEEVLADFGKRIYEAYKSSIELEKVNGIEDLFAADLQDFREFRVTRSASNIGRKLNRLNSDSWERKETFESGGDTKPVKK